jgi:aldehyde dehydrogenase (NAD+)
MKTIVFIYFLRKIKYLQKNYSNYSFGGGCINDTVVHFSNKLAFGGVGHSGIGAYHGSLSLILFT